MLTKDQKRVLKRIPLDVPATFKVPPPPGLAGLPDEIWHVSEPYADNRTGTYWITLWSDNGDRFEVDSGQTYLAARLGGAKP